MTQNIYVIDSSSLINLNRYSPIDVFPSVWKNLESLISQDRLVAPLEVLNEITQKDDQLSKWVKEQTNFFRDVTEKQTEIAREILKLYPSIVRVDRKYDADSWVIALAIEMKSDPQQTLVHKKIIVVTGEKNRGERVRIPYVCQKYQVDAIDIMEMFRIEGWKF